MAFRVRHLLVSLLTLWEAQLVLGGSSCEPFGDLHDVKVNCTGLKENSVGSVCTFACEKDGDDYILHPAPKYPKKTVTSICRESNKWSRKKIPRCCLRPCTSSKIDLFFVLDSSSSVEKKDWRKVIRFVSQIIGILDPSGGANKIAAIRFNQFVHEKSQIHLNDYNTTDSLLTSFKEKFRTVDGSGTYIGNALRYVLDKMMKKSVGDRPKSRNVVILITDGKSSDEPIAPAKELRAKRAQVFVIGVEPRRGTLDKDQIKGIAGDDDHVLIPERGYDALTFYYASKITDKVCGNPCIV